VQEVLIQQLQNNEDLSEEQIHHAVQQLVSEDVPAEPKAAFLTALADKGESIEEIAGFSRLLRDKSIRPPIRDATRARDILDVCGTGGDKLNTFNISTTVAILVAAAGVPVAKHGNRAITSKSGSADVLEALGIRIDLAPDVAAQFLQDHQFAFFFAPHYHPAFKHIGPARKLCAEQGRRTIFNFLGPLLNPARPSAQLIGVPSPALTEPVARVLQSLGIRRGMAVSGQAGQTPEGKPAYLDELSTLGETSVAEFYQDKGFHQSTFSPAQFPLQPAQLADLAGRDREMNATIIKEILNGNDTGPKRDAVLLNAGAALFVANRTHSISEGWDLAASLIDQGAARAKLEELIKASAEC
jgi:anthranilate phosphoribosyltransferase